MGNVLTYLKWRSEFEFSNSKFCEVDNLVLSLLSYVDFSGEVSSGNDSVKLADAYNRLSSKGLVSSVSVPGCTELFQRMAESKRFGSARLSMYRTEYDEESATQFAAVKIKLSDESIYIAFRGTDESIAGWQEDFSIGSQVVPSQRLAVQYLQEALVDEGEYRVGGHSKGGNLAMYAAMNCDQATCKKIIAVYNNDGPGFSREVIDPKSYSEIDNKLTWIVPGFSVIGTLFPHRPPNMIVQSSAKGFMQHDGFSWQIEGSHFCTRDCPEPESEFYVRTFDTWINSASLEQREVFTKDFFGALRSGGATDIHMIQQDGIDGFGTILLSIVQSESRTKIVIGKFINSILQNCRHIDFCKAIRSRKTLTGIALAFVGLLLMLFSGTALQLLLVGIGVAGMAYSVKRLFWYALNGKMGNEEKKKKLAVWLFAIVAIELVTVNQSIATALSKFAVSAVLFLIAGRTIYTLAKKEKSSIFEKIVITAISVIAVLLGIVSLSGVGTEQMVVFTVGTVVVTYGIITTFMALYQSGKENHSSR